MTHVLIVTAVCDTRFQDHGLDIIPGDKDAEMTIYRQGTPEELEALVNRWPIRVVTPDPFPSFEAYMTDMGFEVGWPLIVRAGV